jgi:hypothetical protein
MWRLAHQHLDGVPRGDFMLAVLNGTATHNSRTREFGPAEDRPFD